MRKFFKVKLLVTAGFLAFAGVFGAGPSALASGNTIIQSQALFFSIMPDVPLMPGMTEDLNGMFVYDKPAGRIMRVRASGRQAAQEDIARFYRKTLPELGWIPDVHNRYIRENEALYLVTGEHGDISFVEITLKPKS